MIEKCINLKSRDGSFKIILRIPGLIENTIVLRGGWESGLAGKMTSFVKDGSIFIDIGSNIGYHTLYIASCCPGAKCICFEPHPSIIKELKRNADINGFINVFAYNYAVGDENGTIDFYLTEENSANRGLSAANLPIYGTGLKKTTVGVVSLDEFLDRESREKVSVLKIDAQGYEYQVIHGAMDLIRRSKPVIFLEYHEESEKTPIEIFNLIPDYNIYMMDAWSGEVNDYEKSDSKCCSDFLCIPPNVKGMNPSPVI